MGDDISDKELNKLYRSRLKDRAQSTTRRRRQAQALPPRFGDVLPGIFAGDNLALEKLAESRAILAWESLVGETVARISQALRVRSHTLIVRVRDPLWMQQLSLCKHDLLKKYREAFPRLKIKDIFFTRN